jgi:hypothetical protein
VQRVLNNWFVKWVVAPVAVLWALGWGYIRTNYPVCTFRYKLTAEVITPQGLRTGSSVIEVTYAHHGDWGGGDGPDQTVNGEAVYVDLGQGKNVFILFSSTSSGREPADRRIDRNYSDRRGASSVLALPIKVFAINWIFGREIELCNELTAKVTRNPVTIPNELLPTLIRLEHLDDPRSAKIVQPNFFSAEFGAGFDLHQVTIEASGEPITRRLDAVLPWLNLDAEVSKIKPPTSKPGSLPGVFYTSFYYRQFGSTGGGNGL